MPFTPFHFGPGAAIKAVVPRHFSLGVFCFAQVLMDAEVLVYMARGGTQLHGWAHTYVGAAVVAIVSILVGRPICEWSLRWWSSTPGLPLKEFFNPRTKITLIAACTGALVGSFSHVFFDSLMHADVQPFLPFSEKTQPHGSLGAGVLHLVFFIAGVIGLWACARGRRWD